MMIEVINNIRVNVCWWLLPLQKERMHLNFIDNVMIVMMVLILCPCISATWIWQRQIVPDGIQCQSLLAKFLHSLLKFVFTIAIFYQIYIDGNSLYQYSTVDYVVFFLDSSRMLQYLNLYCVNIGTVFLFPFIFYDHLLFDKP